MRRTFRSALALALVTASTACASTTTRLATLEPEVVAAEQQKQRALAVEYQWEQQNRLDRIAYPLLKSATPFCQEKTASYVGLRFGDTHGMEEAWRAASEDALGLTNIPAVIAVTEGGPAALAGLMPRDELVRVGAHSVTPGPRAVQELGAYIERYRTENAGQALAITYRRNGSQQTVQVHPDMACDYGVAVVNDGALNAYADGKAIYLTGTMMRFAEDHELTSVVAHEIAHNVMGHIQAMQKNALVGGLLGALGDIAMAASGYNTAGYYTSQGVQIGAGVFGQDFEREADYVGMYLIARAGLDMDRSADIWRHMAQASPGSIALATSHPTTAERFVRLELAIEEIEAKLASGEELVPEMKTDSVQANGR